MDTEEILNKINKVTWFHAYEVLPGIVTPGICRVQAESVLTRKFGIPGNLRGQKALEIGAWDGPYSFELEKRGAEVTALDIQDPDCTGFNLAKELRQSQVKYVQASVYDATKCLSEQFDIILFLGVYYHLKHPILAFEQLHQLLKEGGLLLVEGECLRNWAPSPKEAEQMQNPLFLQRELSAKEALRTLNVTVLLKKCYYHLTRPRRSRFVKAMAESDIPIALFYSGKYKQDSTNWYIPNVSCLREWLSGSGFKLEAFGCDDTVIPSQRFWGRARRLEDVHKLSSSTTPGPSELLI